MAGDVKHDYHLVNPSPWPLIGSIFACSMMFGLIVWRYSEQELFGFSGPWFFIIGLAGVLFTMAGWWTDIVRESMRGENTSDVVRIGLRYGMVLFIVSEVMFFAAWFWAFFAGALYPDAGQAVMLADGTQLLLTEGLSEAVLEQNEDGFPAQMMNYAKGAALGAEWPPVGVEPLSPWGLPFVNTVILLLSGTTVTWAHHAITVDDHEGFVWGMVATIALGVVFSFFQGVEYYEAISQDLFSFGGGSIYGSSFFMATGFHGFHVIVGTLFLIVCLFRGLAGQFTKDRHFGFEAAAWYWHFVDVVWLFLFAMIYILGNQGLLS